MTTRLQFRNMVLLGALALPLMGCDSLSNFNPFERPAPPLPGTRKDVFPGGVAPTDRTLPLPYNPNATGADLPSPDQKGKTKQRKTQS